MSEIEPKKVKKFLKLMKGKKLNLKHWDWKEDPEGCYLCFDSDNNGELTLNLKMKGEPILCFPLLACHKPKLRFYRKRVIHLFYPTNLKNWPLLTSLLKQVVDPSGNAWPPNREKHDHMMVFTFLRCQPPGGSVSWKFNFVITDKFGSNRNHSGHGGGGRN